MERRGFLKLFGATVATAAGVMVLDPEAALWRPGAKLISIPPAPRTTLGCAPYGQTILVRSAVRFIALDGLVYTPESLLEDYGVQLIQPWGPRS